MKPAQAMTLLLALVLAAWPGPPACANQLVADLSDNLVSISTGFTGADVLLFGASDGEGDIVVVITGPPESVVVRRKQRLAGIWANTRSVAFKGVANFYTIAATRPLSEIAPPEVLKTYGIGIDHLSFEPADAFADWSDARLAPFREALIRNKQRGSLYSSEPEPVTLVSERLFRTWIHFPPNMATGSYTAVVYRFDELGTVEAVSIPMLIQKSGVGAEVYDFAHNSSALYGIGAILAAVAAGWLSGVLFRKI